MRKQTKVEKQLEQMIYGTRLLLLLECDCGEHFWQVALDEQQFKAMSEAVFGPITPTLGENGLEEISTRLIPMKIPGAPLAGLQDFYSKELLAQIDHVDDEQEICQEDHEETA